MQPRVAKIVLISIPWILIGWTILVYMIDKSPEWTTSCVARKCTNAYPILAWLLGYVCCGCLKDAFPQIDWLQMLFVVGVPIACIGHILWGF